MSNEKIFFIAITVVLLCSPWFWKLLAGIMHLIAIAIFLAIFIWAFKSATTPYRCSDYDAKGSYIAAPEDIMPFVKGASEKYNIGVDTILAVIQIESGFDINAVSYTGAQGLMQIMPATQESVGITDPFDPEQNVMGGTKYLSWQMKRFGNLDLALAAYNAGPGAVEAASGDVPYCAETYVDMVKKNIEDRYGNEELAE